MAISVNTNTIGVAGLIVGISLFRLRGAVGLGLTAIEFYRCIVFWWNFVRRY